MICGRRLYALMKHSGSLAHTRKKKRAHFAKQTISALFVGLYRCIAHESMSIGEKKWISSTKSVTIYMFKVWQHEHAEPHSLLLLSVSQTATNMHMHMHIPKPRAKRRRTR